jgi:hypothetical protein
MSYKMNWNRKDDAILVQPADQLIPAPTTAELLPAVTPIEDSNTPQLVSRRHRIDWRLVTPRAAVVTRSVSQSTI